MPYVMNLTASHKINGHHDNCEPRLSDSERPSYDANFSCFHREESTTILRSFFDISNHQT